MALREADLVQMMEALWQTTGPPQPLVVVDHGFDCVGADTTKPVSIGDKVRVALSLNGHVIQCRPGVVTALTGVPDDETPIYVDFGDRGAWFERDMISHEDG